jgi:hypothetical protein
VELGGSELLDKSGTISKNLILKFKEERGLAKPQTREQTLGGTFF